MRRCSFALVEVCVALIIVAVVSGYLFISSLQTVNMYRRFTDEITCQLAADELFSQFLASYLITPLEFDSIITKWEKVDATEDGFIIIKNASAQAPPDDAQKPATKLLLTLSVHSPRFYDLSAGRSTTLCVVKGDHTVKVENE
jgi:hypothetical protein